MRRTVEYVIRLTAAHAIERAKNRTLVPLQTQFEAALLEGEILELTPGEIKEITRVVQEELGATASAS